MKLKSFFIMMLMVYSVLCCDDVLEKDISKDGIILLAPSDGFTTTDTSVMLWWEKLEGVDEYQIRIGSPDLKNANYIVVDELIEGNKHTVALAPGNYEWCVRGVNSAYKTEFECRSLIVQ